MIIVNLYEFIKYITYISAHENIVLIGKKNRYYFDKDYNMHYFPKISTDWNMLYDNNILFNKSFISKQDKLSKVKIPPFTTGMVDKKPIISIFKKIKVNFFTNGVSYTDTIINIEFDSGQLRENLMDFVLDITEDKHLASGSTDTKSIDTKSIDSSIESDKLLDLSDIDTDF